MKRVDKGDGTFEERQECQTKYREEPVMRRWCTYAVFQWTQIDEKVNATRDGSEPAWPTTGVTPAAQAPGARREGARHEVFEVEVQEPKGGKHTCAVGQALWTKLAKGTVARGEVRASSGALVCDTLRVK